ncbi:MAG: response regulator [Thermomicrobiales bacterium]
MTTILVVDDDHAVREALMLLLEDAGYAVCTAVNGMAALPLITPECPDLVVTDLHMPGLDGLGLIAQVQSARPDLPILVVSAGIRMTVPSDVPVVFKPFDVENLLSTVARLLPAEDHRGDATEPSPRRIELIREGPG